MKTKLVKSWRKSNELLLEPMTVAELKENSNKEGFISAKLLFNLDDLIGFDMEWLNDEASERITDSVAGLTDISYKVAGSTPDCVIIKVTGNVSEHIAEEEYFANEENL